MTFIDAPARAPEGRPGSRSGAPGPGTPPGTPSPALAFLLAASCGLIVANLYYAQPLVGPIAASLGASPESVGLMVTLTQVGYALGLLFVVPLADLVENRRLVLGTTVLGVLALVGTGLSTHLVPLLVWALLVGVGSVAVQILVPYAAHLAPEAVRGRAVGNVMGGLMVGIMLARPVASFLTELGSWHTVFFVSAAATSVLVRVLARRLPVRRPGSSSSYAALLRSMGDLALSTPVLQRRAFYHACLFGAFSVFWTTVPLLLAGPAFGLSQSGIAWFALAGVAGAVAAPVAGRLADRGWTRACTGLAMAGTGLAFALSVPAARGGGASLASLVGVAVLLDYAVTTNLTLGQRAIFALPAERRSRLNGLYLATFFAGGAAGSAVGVHAWAAGGWPFVAGTGIALALAALAGFATERRATPIA